MRSDDVLLPLLTLLWFLSQLWMYIDDDDMMRITPTTTIVGIIFSITLLVDCKAFRPDKVLFLILSSFGVVICTCVLLCLTYRFELSFHVLGQLKAPIATLPIFIHAVLGLVRLISNYDNTGTSRPAWTNWLG